MFVFFDAFIHSRYFENKGISFVSDNSGLIPATIVVRIKNIGIGIWTTLPVPYVFLAMENRLIKNIKGIEWRNKSKIQVRNVQIG